MININQVCDYIIMKVTEGEVNLNLLKLQKLLYYVQAWHLAFFDKTAFNGKFQAWIHGPVNRLIYNRFSDRKSLYSDVDEADMLPDFDPNKIPKQMKEHIDNVLEAYAKFSGSQLEEMTHGELPWKMARKGYRSSQRCEVEISEDVMKQYCLSLLKKYPQ